MIFLAYQWLPIFTLGLLSFSGPTGGTTFPMNGTSFHWYQELWRASVMNDFKPPLMRSVLLAARLLGHDHRSVGRRRPRPCAASSVATAGSST